METEKLEEAKKTFEEDRQKFKTYKDELAKKASEITDNVNRLTVTKANKIKHIMEIKTEIQKVKSETKKIMEELTQYKQYKAFLDNLAIQSGLLKKENLQKEEKKREDDGTFLTQKNNEELMIYFDKQSLLQRLQHMEEDNLFRIYLVKEEEQSLDLLIKQRNAKLAQKEKEIDDVLKNIAMLETSKQALLAKTQYLVQSMNMKENKQQQQQKEE